MRQIGGAAQGNTGMAEKTSAAVQHLLDDAAVLADEMIMFTIREARNPREVRQRVA